MEETPRDQISSGAGQGESRVKKLVAEQARDIDVLKQAWC